MARLQGPRDRGAAVPRSRSRRLIAPPFDLVIFDLDDTLIEFRREVRLAALAAATGLAESHIHAAIWGSDFERAAERDAHSSGDDYPRAFNARIGAELVRRHVIG